MIQLPHDLFVDCCRAFKAQDDNHGTWPGGEIAEPIRRAINMYFPEEHEVHQQLILRQVCCHQAIHYVVEKETPRANPTPHPGVRAKRKPRA